MSEANQAGAEVAVVIGEDELFLVPTLRAAIAVNRRFGGFVPAVQRVGNLDLDAMAQIVAAGLNRREPAEIRALQEAIFAHGVGLLVGSVTRFVELLSNGGREPGTEPPEKDAPSKKS